MNLKVPQRGDGTRSNPFSLKYHIPNATRVRYSKNRDFAIVEIPKEYAEKWLEKDDIEKIEIEIHMVK